MLWWVAIICPIVTHSTVLIPNSHVQDLTSCLAYDNTNTRFSIVTMFMGALAPTSINYDSDSWNPLVVSIWPHTAAKLFSQYWCPLGPFTFADVARVNSSLQPLQHMVKTDANPSLFLFVYHYVVIGLVTGCVIGNEF